MFPSASDLTGISETRVLLKVCYEKKPVSTLKELSLGIKNLTGLDNNINCCPVPKTSPLTRVQFESCNKLWPTQFHENK